MDRADPLRRAIQEYRDEDEDWNELTPVLTEAVQTALRQDRDSRPDSLPPSGLSMRWGSAHLGTHGRISWLVAILIAVVALAWIVTRPQTPTSSPRLPSAAAAHS